MDQQKEMMFRNYAWAYFALHADQRMKTFNFFLIAAGLLAGGIATLVRDGGDPRWVSPLGIVLTLLSLTFWKLDHRNKQLVRNAEAAIKHLDSLHDLPLQDGAPHVLSIFARDDYFSERAKTFPLTEGRFSYSKCLGIVFGLFSLLGLFFALGCFFIQKAQP